jgi:hypothetical protein
MRIVAALATLVKHPAARGHRQASPAYTGAPPASWAARRTGIGSYPGGIQP